MAETLVIRLRAAPEAPASWLIVDANGARSGPARTGSVTDAVSLATGRRVLLLLPGSEVTLAEPELPLRGGARVAQAVPFALEEHLASDVDALHFAIGNRTDAAIGTPVAAVARGLMDRWNETCLLAGLAPQAAYADSAVVPVAPGGCTLLLDESALYIRRSDAMPFVLDAEPLDTALDIALGPPSDERPHEHVTFLVSPPEYEANRDLIEGLRARTASLHVKLMTEGALPVLAAQAVATNAVNLLQGAYAPRRAASGRVQRWRLPAALAAACLLTFLASQALSLWKLSRAEKRLDAQITEVFQQALPGQPVVDPRAQMQGVLGGAGSAQGALLPALSVLAQAMAGAPAGGKLEAVNLRGDALDLRLVAPTVEALDGIKQAMARNGIDAELTSATPRGDVVEGRLQLKLGPA